MGGRRKVRMPTLGQGNLSHLYVDFRQGVDSTNGIFIEL